MQYYFAFSDEVVNTKKLLRRSALDLQRKRILVLATASGALSLDPEPECTKEADCTETGCTPQNDIEI